MQLLRFVMWAIPAGLVVLGAGVASSQNYPNKPIRIVTSAVGGGNDFIARLIAQGINGPLGQSVIVENRPSNIAPEIVARASPDGYTLLLAGGTFLIGPLLEKLSYNPVRDFSPITLVDSSPNVLVVHPSVPANSVKEFIALAKAKPGALNYASGNTGSLIHLAAELFKSMAGVNFVRVPYKGTGQAVNDLVGGQVQLMFATAASVAPHIKSGKLRGLAVTSAQPSALAPGLPTIASTLPGYEAVGESAMYASGKTPTAIIKRLNQEIVRVLNQADIKEKFLTTGSEPAPSSPEKHAIVMKAEIATWSKLIKDAGIKAN